MKKLVSIHRPYIILLLIILGFQSTQAQVWTIQQCIDTAQVHNKNLQISKNNIQSGEQKQMEAMANLFPKINANADYRYYTNLPYQLMPLSVFGGPDGKFKEAQFGVPHNINANLQFSMPLYNSQIIGAIQNSKLASEINLLQYKKTEEQIYFEISNLYYNVQILNSQLAFIDSNLLNSKLLLKNVLILKEQLLAKGSDVNKIQLQVEQLTTQRALIKSKTDQVLNALKFTIGLSSEQKIEIDLKIKYQDKIQYANSTTTDIQLVKTQNRFIKNELRTIRNSKLPSLSLFGTYGTMGYGYDKVPNDFLKFYPIGFGGVQLNFPLLNGTVTQRKINQKKIDLKNSELQQLLVIEQNNMLVENAKLQRESVANSVETNLSQIQLAKSIYDQTVLQQKQGIANLTDVLLADNSLRESQQNYLSAVIEYLKSDLELKKLTGNISTTK
ncbi:MAG: TolC family protein [Bacteroidota bacterium]